MLKWCVLVGLDWVEPMMFLLLHVTYSCIFNAYVPFFSSYWYSLCLVLFCMFFFLSLSFFRLVALWHLNVSPLRPGALFILGHLLLLPLLILHPLMFDSVMKRPVWTSRRTFHNAIFIRNAKSFYWTFLILTLPLSSTVGVGSHCVASWSLVPLWSYRSFTPICIDSTILYLILTLVFKVRAL